MEIDVLTIKRQQTITKRYEYIIYYNKNNIDYKETFVIIIVVVGVGGVCLLYGEGWGICVKVIKNYAYYYFVI